MNYGEERNKRNNIITNRRESKNDQQANQKNNWLNGDSRQHFFFF